MDIKDKIVLTPYEAAQLTGMSENEIREWCNDKKNGFPSFKRGKYNKIPTESLKKWLVTQGEIRSEL